MSFTKGISRPIACKECDRCAACLEALLSARSIYPRLDIETSRPYAARQEALTTVASNANSRNAPHQAKTANLCCGAKAAPEAPISCTTCIRVAIKHGGNFPSVLANVSSSSPGTANASSSSPSFRLSKARLEGHKPAGGSTMETFLRTRDDEHSTISAFGPGAVGFPGSKK